MNKLISILFSFCCLNLVAQIPVVKVHPTKDLGDLHLTTVYQDAHGWIWVGAQNGVYRFDGQEFMPVKFPEGITPGPVTVLFESQNRLWVGFQSGDMAYLPNIDNGMPLPAGDVDADLSRAPVLTLWNPEEGLPQAPIKGIVEDRQGALWIATYGEGVYVWKNGRLYQFNQEDDGLASDDIYAITVDREGRVWLATDGGISVCAMPEQGKKQVHNLTKADGLPDEIVTSIATDMQGNIWCGTDEKGLFRYNTATWQLDLKTPDWPYGAITNLRVFGDSEVWAGTEKNGMIRFDAGNGTMFSMQAGHPLAATKFRSMCKDREGLLWLVAERGVLYSVNVRLGVIDTPFSHIQAICTDRSGGFWVGSREGLYRQKGQVFTPVLPQKENIVSLWVSPADGTVWAGSLGNGVFLVHPDGGVLRHLPEWETHTNGSVLSIAGDSERVWLATLGGVSVLNLKTLQEDTSVPKDKLGSNYVYKVLTDSKGRVWFGTDGDGLVAYECGAFHAYSEANGIALRTIYSIVEDHKGNIWFSTAKDGLFRFDGQTFKRYTTVNHLHSMVITGLAVDGNNQIVIGYEDGFDILNPERLDHLNFCGAEANMPAFEVNLNALWSDAGGNVWLGTQHSIIRAAAHKEPIIDDPQPGITAVSVFLQPIDFLQKTFFAYDQNSFLFNFVGLWYSDPESVRYRYRLEGFDPEWKISKDHTASYPKLPPGNYTFRVQTSEHGNFSNVPEASWSFTIGHPFWQRWWFLLLAGIALVGVFRAFIQMRETRLKREAQLNRERVESQFETLKSHGLPQYSGH